jgi:hypothetical protein
MKSIGIHRRWLGSALVPAAIALAAVTVARPVSAAEALGDLDVQVRIVELTPGNGPAGPSMTGVAKIEVLVQAIRETRDVQVRILRPDGSTWKVKGRPLLSGRPEWTGPGGEPLEPDSDGQSVGARGAMRTTIVVPLEGAALHEIVVAVTGLVGGEPIATSGVVRAALGDPHTQPVDDGTHANFFLNEVK